MSSQVYSRPIIALLIALIGGIVLGVHFPGHMGSLLIISLVSAGYIGIKIVYQKTAALAPLIFFMALGYISVQPWLSPNFSTHHIHFFSDEISWQVAGVVDSQPVESTYIKRFVLHADRLTHKKVSHRVTGKIRVSVRGPGPEIAKGDRVMFRSRLREIRNFNNPGGFDYQRFMAFQNIWRSAYTDGRRLKVISKKASMDLSQRVHKLRRAVATLSVLALTLVLRGNAGPRSQ